MELRIDELANRAGTTSRTIRDYQARGLLPPPRLEGRTGWYSDEHLHRLNVIADLQQRGFSLAAIRETLDAWSAGNDLQGLLDFEHVLLAPWGEAEHQAQTMPLDELVERFAFLGDQIPAALEGALEVGILEVDGDGGVKVPAPSVLEGAEELLRLGMSVDDLLGLLAATQADVGRVARRFVDAAAPTILDLLDEEGLGRTMDAVRRLRPLALMAVRAVLDAELRAAIGDQLTDVGIDVTGLTSGTLAAAQGDDEDEPDGQDAASA